MSCAHASVCVPVAAAVTAEVAAVLGLRSLPMDEENKPPGPVAVAMLMLGVAKIVHPHARVPSPPLQRYHLEGRRQDRAAVFSATFA